MVYVLVDEEDFFFDDAWLEVTSFVVAFHFIVVADFGLDHREAFESGHFDDVLGSFSFVEDDVLSLVFYVDAGFVALVSYFVGVVFVSAEYEDICLEGDAVIYRSFFDLAPKLVGMSAVEFGTNNSV